MEKEDSLGKLSKCSQDFRGNFLGILMFTPSSEYNFGKIRIGNFGQIGKGKL